MSDDPHPLRQRIAEQLQAIIHEDPDQEWSMVGGIVTKFVIGIEVALPDGDRVLYTTAAQGMKSWETLGILETMAATERNDGLNHYRPDDDEP